MHESNIVTTPLPVSSGPRSAVRAFALLSLLAAQFAHAQVAITGITYGTLVDNANTTSGGITYLNRDSTVSSVASSLGDYQFTGPLADNVFFRRNTDSNGNGTPNQAADNPNNTTLIYQANGSNQAYGNYHATAEQIFRDGDLYSGIRNPFANGAGTAANSNIERIDFYFSGGYTVQANDAVVFFDVENADNFGDGFRLAAYTAIGTVNGQTNAPTAYATAGLFIAPNSFGGLIKNPEGTSTGTYRRATFTNADNLSGTASGLGSSGLLQMVGIQISFADLGISAGTTIYGYSLMAGDTAPTTAVDLVNWNSATFYPTNTDPTGYGNMDFMGFGAQIARPVPESSTYGAILLGLGTALVGFRRWRRSLRAA